MVSECCCGDRCNLPGLPADKHWCPGCKKPIHGVCGVVDESQESIAHMNWCHDCHESRKMPAQQQMHHEQQNTKKKPPPKKPTTDTPLTSKKQSGRPRRSNGPFKIVVPAQHTDSLMGRKVAFPLDGADRPQWLNNPTLQQYGEEIGGSQYLLGIVSRSKTANSKTPYLVEWEATRCGTTPMDGGTVMSGIEKAVQLQEYNQSQKDTNRRRHPLSSRLREKLFEVDEEEVGDHLASDDDSDDNSGNDDESIYETGPPAMSSFKSHFLDLRDLMDSGFQVVQTVDDASTVNEIDVVQDGLRWKVGGMLQPPLNVSSNVTSKLKVGTAHHFTTPLSSFLSFVPLDFWKLWLYETNRYGSQKLMKENAVVAFKPIVLQEFMTFMGILLAMTLQPMPGRRYTKAWDEPDLHPYTKYMKKSRFIQLRSILHMVNNENPNSHKDSLYKVRPLLNVLKKTLGAFIDVGSECSLDESSVACRSAYGRHFIYYNPTKPTGKYHFRFYLLCETDFYNCVRFRMQTRDECDVGDGLNVARQLKDGGTINDDKKNEQPGGVMQKLVLDMCSPLFFTGKVVNTDNYYTSPLVFVELLKNGVYARGTCRGNRVAFPKMIQFSSSEANKGKRGDLRIATSQDPPLVAFSWLDGNPVNFLTSADGTEHAEVKRRIARNKQSVPAPAAVARYNKNMQAVDRFDQLNQLFSLAKRHKFQKYYNKLTMALLDIALVNAEQHYFMVEGRSRGGEARYNFRKEMVQLFFDTAWDFFESDGDIGLNSFFTSPQDISIQVTYNTGNVRRTSLGRPRDDGFLLAPNADESTNLSTATGGQHQQLMTTTCHPISVMAYMKQNNSKKTGAGRSYRGSRCQVCAWEMRTNVTKHVAFCSEHGIRMCTVHRPVPIDSPFSAALMDPIKSQSLKEWYCPDLSATCWQKGHEFYIPRGVWGKAPRLRYNPSGCPKTICAAIGATLYRKRADWLVSEGLLDSAPRSRGRKRKSNSCGPVPEFPSVEDARPANAQLFDGGEDDIDHFYDADECNQTEDV